MSETFTLSKVSRLTGVKPRTIQFWTQSGVIHCDPETEHGGPGVPRRYPEDEVAIALVVGEISRMPLQVGALRQIAQALREVIHCGSRMGFKDWKEGQEYYWRKFEEYNDALEKNELRSRTSIVKPDKIIHRWIMFERARLAIDDGYISDDVTLFLTIDDVGRWQLNIDSYEYYKEGEPYDTKAPVVWALQLQLNLTRTLARLRV